MARGELSAQSIEHQAEAYLDFETRHPDLCADERSALFARWANSKDFHPTDREAIRCALESLGVKVANVA